MDWRMTRHTTRGRSLLSKTLMHFALCAAICFVLTAPLFYLLTKWFYAEDLIEIVEAVKERQMIPDIDLERDIVGGMMLQFMLIFVVITIAMFVTMRLATKKLWHPFDDTLRKAEQFSLAQGSVPQFASTDIVEFARLNHTLEQLMLNAKHTYIAQKEFTENASHELQTPLAIVRTKLDLLMQGNLGEGEMRLVADLYELTMRMSRLNRNLLLLAKIENSQYADIQKVDVAAMIADAAPLYDALTDGTAIRPCLHHRQPRAAGVPCEKPRGERHTPLRSRCRRGTDAHRRQPRGEQCRHRRQAARRKDAVPPIQHCRRATQGQRPGARHSEGGVPLPPLGCGIQIRTAPAPFRGEIQHYILTVCKQGFFCL